MLGANIKICSIEFLRALFIDYTIGSSFLKLIY